ncbi:GntP family permease [Beijerinckia indica]|uniref:Citrate transporter n=1 Tax=Beijerinckia indica subsp. indica (strain ATCC 9039 / DSM 1715 / NCIMB 8712) TaxID=395963 RepID=B2IEU3_BEII9|nr:GntP family permease [Beijerinckia indica]ACB94216.1 Citrate transporter [Beijerinckia indica subsp. indica ATCC 9039]
MSILVALLGLAFLIFVAYRGFSVILFAPIAAMIPVVLTEPSSVPAVFTGLFMEKAVVFVKLYFPLFILGAVFGKVIELSGFSKSIVSTVIHAVGAQRAILSIVLVAALLTYGGVSLFVVVFAVYPFAAEMFRQAGIPKRLIPATLALGAFSFTMDAVPGTPQIQNIIPTTFFQTNSWAAPWLGTIGSLFIFITGMLYLEWRRRSAGNEGYGTGHINEPAPVSTEHLAHPLIAFLPLLGVFVFNIVLTGLIPKFFGPVQEVTLPGLTAPIITKVPTVTAIWALEGALLLSILLVVVLAFRPLKKSFMEGSKLAVAGALLATMNTASEYGFGAVIAALPGFLAVREALQAIPNPLVNAAIVTTTLAGITGSASGGLSIALAAMADQFIAGAHAAGIPLEVMHRVTAMASGGMDILPHNGAVITVLAVTGLTHRQSYNDIFVIALLKTSAVFFIIGVYYATGLV